MKRLSQWLRVIVLLVGATPAWAAIDTYEFDSPQQEQLFRELTEELRCPKCQNNSLHDSDSELAKDLRDLVYAKVRDGASREQVVSFLVERYGPFIHYEPPSSAAAMVVVPVALFLLGALIWVVWWVRRPPSPGDEVAAAERGKGAGDD